MPLSSSLAGRLGRRSIPAARTSPFLPFQVREGKGLQTTTIDNNSHPEWNETMLFVVDDPVSESAAGLLCHGLPRGLVHSARLGAASATTMESGG